MEAFINNPGLQHLAEKVFLNLDVEDLKICAQINQLCKQILEDPMLWLKKFRNLSRKNQKDWIIVLKSVKCAEKRKAIISYLQWQLKKDVVDLPCYSNSAVQDDFGKKILKSFYFTFRSSNEDMQIVKLLAPLTENFNPKIQASFRDKILKCCKKWESSDEDTEIIKILAPLTDNLNAPNKHGITPIHWAAWNGHTEIVKILVSFTINPNTPDKYGTTPIYWAAHNGHTEVCRILKPFETSKVFKGLVAVL